MRVELRRYLMRLKPKPKAISVLRIFLGLRARKTHDRVFEKSKM